MDVLNEAFTWATGLIDSLTQLVTDSPITYLIIFALAGVDVLAPILPAEATITAASVLAGQGQLNLVWIMVAAGAGAFIGDNVAYWVGRAAGRPVVRRILGEKTDQLDDVQRQFDKRGGIFIIIGRFVPGGRTVVAVSAGVLRFDWLRFLAYDALAAVVWSFQAALPGFIGGSLVQGEPWLAMVFGFVLSGSLALALALGQRWWQGRHGDEDGPADREGTGADVKQRHGLRRRVVSRVTGVPIALPGEDLAATDIDASGSPEPDRPSLEPHRPPEPDALEPKASEAD